MAISPAADRPLRVLKTDSADCAVVLDAITAENRGRAAARAAAETIATRLRAVMAAIHRCEGEAESCADPARNASLARAAEAARTASASDAMILKAITLVWAGEIDWTCAVEDEPDAGPDLIVSGPPTPDHPSRPGQRRLEHHGPTDRPDPGPDTPRP